MSSIKLLLEEFLGDGESNSSGEQITFDCPHCAAQAGLERGDGKHNLEVNVEKHVFKCWVCWEDGTHGSIYKLIKKFGNKNILNKYLKELEYLDFKKSFEDQKTINSLLDNVTALKRLKKPTNIKLFNEGTLEFEPSQRYAFNYLNKRNIDFEIINKYRMGFITNGELELPEKKKILSLNNRIYLPSYNTKGFVNYFTLRDYSDKAKKYKYINPEFNKKEIIFNEYYINYDADVYLVEGPFDHIVTPNSIPMLGKECYDLIYYTLQEKAKANVIIFLDGDAYDKALLLYNKLNSGNLKDRIKVIKLSDKLDPSKIYELYGKRGMLRVLQNSFKPKENELIYF